MTDILKTETEAIVNLAEHLTNLNSKVSQLSSPVFQLHEEIKVNLARLCDGLYKISFRPSTPLLQMLRKNLKPT